MENIKNLDWILQLSNINVNSRYWNKEIKKLESSKEIMLLGEKYYIDFNFFKEIKLLDFNNASFKKNDFNEINENISNLNIEGVITTRIASSRAKESAREYFSDNSHNEANKMFIEEWEKREKSRIIKSIDENFNKINPDKRPSKIVFMQDYGLNLAINFIALNPIGFNITNEYIYIIYSYLTLFGECLEENEKLSKGNFYRDDIVNIFDTRSGQIIDKGDDPKIVEKNMNQLIDLFNRKIQPFENNEFRTVVSILSFLFIKIHPYFDGNGRMSRILIKLISNQFGIDGIFYTSFLNEIIRHTRKAYYDSIRYSRETNDLTYYAAYMNYVYINSFIVNIIILEKNQQFLFNDGPFALPRALSPFSQYIVLILILSNNEFTSWKIFKDKIIGAKELSEQRIKQILNELVEMKLLKKQSESKVNLYKLEDHYWNIAKEIMKSNL